MVKVRCIHHPRYPGKKWPLQHCKWCEMIYVLLNCQH